MDQQPLGLIQFYALGLTSSLPPTLIGPNFISLYFDRLIRILKPVYFATDFFCGFAY